MRSLLVALLVLGVSGCRLSANLHEIDAGKAYRSAQLDEGELRAVISGQGIRTIINLRGANPGSDWFDAESRVAQETGVKMVNIPMSAGRLPTRADLIALLDAFQTVERPFLVHCRAGADRTGEAMAIYQMEYMGKSRDEALEMLTLKYLHLDLGAPAKRYFIRDIYRGEAWARAEYEPCRATYDYFDRASLCSGNPAADPNAAESPAPVAASTPADS